MRKASRARWGELLQANVEIFEYQPTMYHCKVLVVDGLWLSVGSTNFDNRSFRLNFEISALSTDSSFVHEVAHMLETDFSHSKEVRVEEFTQRSFPFRLACRAARLMAPVL